MRLKKLRNDVTRYQYWSDALNASKNIFAMSNERFLLHNRYITALLQGNKEMQETLEGYRPQNIEQVETAYANVFEYLSDSMHFFTLLFSQSHSINRFTIYTFLYNSSQLILYTSLLSHPFCWKLDRVFFLTSPNYCTH